MSRQSRRPLDHPYHLRTARKVSRASSSPLSTWRSSPDFSRTRSITLSPFAASRSADVANASTDSAPLSSAISSASTQNAIRRLAPPVVMRPLSSSISVSRSSILCLKAGSGRAPGWASTSSRCAVFEPTSSTASRIPRRYRHSGTDGRTIATWQFAYASTCWLTEPVSMLATDPRRLSSWLRPPDRRATRRGRGPACPFAGSRRGSTPGPLARRTSMNTSPTRISPRPRMSAAEETDRVVRQALVLQVRLGLMVRVVPRSAWETSTLWPGAPRGEDHHIAGPGRPTSRRSGA